MRMGKIIVISLLCLTLAAGAACGDGEQQAQPTPTATPAGKTVHVGPADTGEELTLDVGDWLVATMTCETGYHWYMVTVSNRSVLGHVLEEYVPWWESDAGDNLNRRIWTLEAKTAGTSDIHMVCNGSQGLDPVTAATFNLSVTVR